MRVRAHSALTLVVLALIASVLAVSAQAASAQGIPDPRLVNTGGDAFTDSSARLWSGDFGAAGGAVSINTVPIAGTIDDVLYQSERYGDIFAYDLPVVDSGCYVITLHFAEIFWGLPGDGAAGGNGSRIFNVAIEGSPVLTNYDIHAEVGAATAVTKTFNTIVSDQTIRLLFTGVVDKAKVSGIEVHSAPFAACDTAPRQPAKFVPVTPVRWFDTRNTSPIVTTGTLDVVFAGVGAIPANATAIVMNLTALNTSANGFVTAFPAGSTRPGTSSLNITAGDTVPNSVTVPIGTGGAISFFALQQLDLVADVSGYYVPAATATDGRLAPLTPTRLFDTRDTTPIATNTSLTFNVLAHPAVPATGVSAVALTITSTNTTANGFITTYPGDQTLPLASTLIARPNQTRTNLAIVPVGADGTVAFYAKTQTDLIVDITAYYTDNTAGSSTAGLYVALTPRRNFDTRLPPPPQGPIAAQGAITVTIAGAVGIPANAIAVTQNVTATAAAGSGFITAYPGGQTQPTIATLVINATDTTRGSGAITPTGTNGTITYYSHGGSHLITDTTGYFTP